jgi:hypothetical protein
MNICIVTAGATSNLFCAAVHPRRGRSPAGRGGLGCRRDCGWLAARQ